MTRYRQPTPRDWLRVIVSLSLFAKVVTAATLVLMFLFPSGHGYIWALALFLSLFLLVRWHAGYTAYRCMHCQYEFEITVAADLVSPHGPGRGRTWKYLKCPRCGRRSRATVLIRTDD